MQRKQSVHRANVKSGLVRAAKHASAELERARRRFQRASAQLQDATQAAAVAVERLRTWETFANEGSDGK